ncbi:MAG TPA: J domain-containing protein [Acidobacteriota bacterium]|nr:J domain-containing protein [Acidobacteriota bacterium]
MDIYKVLKVPVNATDKEIDQAYRKLIKESQYDSSIQVKELEIAYRILSDSKQRAIYDSKKGIAAKPATGFKGFKASLKGGKKKGKQKGFVDHKKRERNLIKITAGLFVISLTYYFLRFGYHLKSFDLGNKIYFKDTNVLFGTLVSEEDNHKFASGGEADGYQVRLPSNEIIWFPATDVKTLCYGKKD